jgi:hypothetical protein
MISGRPLGPQRLLLGWLAAGWLVSGCAARQSSSPASAPPGPETSAADRNLEPAARDDSGIDTSATGATAPAASHAAPSAPMVPMQAAPEREEPAQAASEQEKRKSDSLQVPSKSSSNDPLRDLDAAESDLDRALSAARGIASSGATSTCESVCRAVSSMQRAADGICRLDEARCAEARARVVRAEERARAVCTSCPRRPPIER